MCENRGVSFRPSFVLDATRLLFVRRRIEILKSRGNCGVLLLLILREMIRAVCSIDLSIYAFLDRETKPTILRPFCLTSENVSEKRTPFPNKSDPIIVILCRRSVAPCVSRSHRAVDPQRAAVPELSARSAGPIRYLFINYSLRAARPIVQNGII